MKTQELLRQHREKRDSFLELGKAAKAILDHNLKKLNIKCENLYGRVKGFNSFLEKAQDRRMSDPFKEMTDIVGLRVICLFQSDIDKVKKVIREIFQVIKEEDRATITPDLFNYTTPHFDVRLRNFPNGELSQIVFEIQVRTICQHTWCSVSHLFYKGEKSIESIDENTKRDFYALNGLLYVADTHFEIINQKTLTKTEYAENKF
jgi:ppGpp synthetase/RelA/SpoT-type nucleotidyltranferase